MAKSKTPKQYMIVLKQDHGDGNGEQTSIEEFTEAEPAFECMVDHISQGHGHAVTLYEVKPITLKLAAKRA